MSDSISKHKPSPSDASPRQNLLPMILIAVAVVILSLNLFTRFRVDQLSRETRSLEAESKAILAQWEAGHANQQEARELHYANNDSLLRLSESNRDATRDLEDLLVISRFDLVAQDKVLHDTEHLFEAVSHIHVPLGGANVELTVETRWDSEKPNGAMQPQTQFSHQYPASRDVELRVRIERPRENAGDSGAAARVPQLVISLTETDDLVIPLPSSVPRGWGREFPQFVQGMNELNLDDYRDLSKGVLPGPILLYDHYVTLEKPDGSRGFVRVAAHATSDQPYLVSPHLVDLQNYMTSELRAVVDRHRERPMNSIQDMFELHESGRWYEIKPEVIEAVKQEGDRLQAESSP